MDSYLRGNDVDIDKSGMHPPSVLLWYSFQREASDSAVLTISHYLPKRGTVRVANCCNIVRIKK